MFKDQ